MALAFLVSSRHLEKCRNQPAAWKSSPIASDKSANRRISHMKIRTVRSIAAMTVCGLFVALAGAASAEGILLPPPVRQSKGDTLKMSCDHARSLVHGSGGTLLYSGPERYDLYHVGGGTCSRLHEIMQAAYVPTRDNAQCFIGYTCEPPVDNQPDRR